MVDRGGRTVWVTEDEAAELLGVGLAEIEELTDRGVLLCMRVAGELRIRRADIESYLDGRPRLSLPTSAEVPVASPPPGLPREAHPSLRQLVRADLGFGDFDGPPRFDEPGWELDGETDIGCDACGACLVVYGKAWRSSVGVEYRFWGIACPSCQGVWELDQYDDETQGWLRDWRRQIGREPLRTASSRNPEPPAVRTPSRSSARPGTSQLAVTDSRSLPRTEPPAAVARQEPLLAVTDRGSLATPTKSPQLVEFYVDLSRLERSHYSELTESIRTRFAELARTYSELLDQSPDTTWSRLKYLCLLDWRARELQQLVAERRRLVSNSSTRRQAINDVLDAIDVCRTRSVILHESYDAGNQSLQALKSRWVEAEILSAGATPSTVNDRVTKCASAGQGLVIVGHAPRISLRADVVVVGSPGLRSCDRALQRDLAGGANCSVVSVIVIGTAEESLGSTAVEELSPDQLLLRHRWTAPGDAASLMTQPSSYEKQDVKDWVIEELPVESAETPVAIEQPQLQLVEKLACRSCRRDNEPGRRRCEHCYGRLVQRWELAP
jgi:excisionase family DNA binding protein